MPISTGPVEIGFGLTTKNATGHVPCGREVDDNVNSAVFRQTNNLSCLPAARPDTTVGILAHSIWLPVVLEVRQDPAVIHLARSLCDDRGQYSIYGSGDYWSAHQVVVKCDNLFDPAVCEIPRKHILLADNGTIISRGGV